MTRRPTISAADKVTVAIRQAWCSRNTSAFGISCPLCKCALWFDQPRILEHLVPRAWTQSDGLDNLAFVHAGCAKVKTFGTKATTAGSDLHRIAKVKRLQVAKLAKRDVEKKLTSQRWRLKKKVSGEIVRVRTK